MGNYEEVDELKSSVLYSIKDPTGGYEIIRYLNSKNQGMVLIAEGANKITKLKLEDAIVLYRMLEAAIYWKKDEENK